MQARRIDAPRQYVRAPMPLQQRIQRPVVIESDERKRVDAVLDHLLRDAYFGREIVVVRCEDHRVAARIGFALQRARRPRIQRVIERRHDGAQHVAAPAAQCARRAVRHVAQLLDRRVHALQRRRIDGCGQVERARDGGRGYAGEARDVARARPPDDGGFTVSADWFTPRRATDTRPHRAPASSVRPPAEHTRGAIDFKARPARRSASQDSGRLGVARLTHRLDIRHHM